MKTRMYGIYINLDKKRPAFPSANIPLGAEEKNVPTENGELTAVYHPRVNSQTFYETPEGFVLLEGTITNLYGKNEKPKGQAQQIWNMFSKQEKGWEKNLSGRFLVVIYEKSKGSFTIINDKLGLKYHYFYHDDSTFLLAPDLMFLMDNMPRPLKQNMPAIAQFLRFEQVLTTDTLLKDAHLIAPATKMEITFEGKTPKVVVSRYWSLEFQKKETTEEQLVDDLDKRFYDTALRIKEMQKDMGTRMRLFLSGGVDSRVIAAYFAKAKVQFSALSVGSRSVDGTVAKEVADKLGVEFQIWDYNKQQDIGEKIRQFARDTCYQTTMKYIPNLLPLDDAGKYADMYIHGNFGDLMFGSYCYPEDMSRSPAELKTHALEKYNILFTKEEIERLFGEEKSAEMNKIAETAFDDVYSNIPQETNNVQKIEYLGLATRVWRITGNVPNLYERYFKVHNYFADDLLLDFFSYSPVESRINQKLYIKTAKKKFPGVFSIPRAYNAAVREPITHSTLIKKLYFLKRAFLYVTGKYNKGVYWNIQQEYKDLEGFRTFIRDCLRSEQLRQRGWYDPTFLDALIEDPNSIPNGIGKMCGLVGLELFMQELDSRNAK